MGEMLGLLFLGGVFGIWLGYVAKTGSGMKYPTVAKRVWCGFFAVLIPSLVLFVVIWTADLPSSSPRLSQSTRQKIYYDMIATQDQNPDSNDWNQGVKEAAADYYNVPMSAINEIVREGASNGWLQPAPP